MSLVNHAQYELELIETDSWMIEGMVKVVQAFAEMSHSGGSASWAIPVLNDLLQFKPLSPLTNDPNEWMLISDEDVLWQSRRNPEAFSHDRGMTYYILSEIKDNDKLMHTSKFKIKET